MNIQDSLIASISAIPGAPVLPTHYTLAIYEGDAPVTDALMITSTNPRIVYDAATACERHRKAQDAHEARRAAKG